MTDNRHGEGEIVPGLLAQLPDDERISVISGEGAYDTRGVYEASASRQADLVVPPRRNGKLWQGRTAGATERNETLRAMRRPSELTGGHYPGVGANGLLGRICQAVATREPRYHYPDWEGLTGQCFAVLRQHHCDGYRWAATFVGWRYEAHPVFGGERRGG